MDGLIFNCKTDELKHKDLYTCAIDLMNAAERKLKKESNHNYQELINEYIDYILQDEQAYVENLRNSKDLEDKKELAALLNGKKIMNLKYWKNYSHLMAIFNEGFYTGQYY